MVVPQFKSLIFSIFLLQTFIFPDFLQAQRNGETGRYVYTDDTHQNHYCHYCEKWVLTTGANEIQVDQCIKMNYPFEKTDEEERTNQWRPFCNTGKLPSCPLLNRILNGEWKCGFNYHLKESEFYNKTVEGYILPVYTSCNLVCIEGYHVNGTNSVYCNESRQWDTETEMIHCVKNSACPLLNRTLNGEWDCGFSHDKMESEFYNETIDGYILPVYTICSLVCIEGYHVTGTNLISCNEHHQWNTETGMIRCAKNSEPIGVIEELNLPAIIGSVVGVCTIGIVIAVIFLCCYICKEASYKTAEEESSLESDASSPSVHFFKGEPVEHEENKDSEDTVTLNLEDERSSLVNPKHAVSHNKLGDLDIVRTCDKNRDKMKRGAGIAKKCLKVKQNQTGPHEEIKNITNARIPVEHKDFSEVDGVHVERKESHCLQEQINKGLNEEQTEMKLRASYKEDNVKVMNQGVGDFLTDSCQFLSKRREQDNVKVMNQGVGDFLTDSCQFLSKRREQGDGMEAGDCSYEQKDDQFFKSQNLNKGIKKNDEMNDMNLVQLCGKGNKINDGQEQTDSVVETDMSVDPIDLDKPKVATPQKVLEFDDFDVDDDMNDSQIQLVRKKKKEKEPTGGDKESPVVAGAPSGHKIPKVKVAYISEEQGQERVLVQKYEDKFLVPHGKRFFFIPKCQGTIYRLNVCKDEGDYRGSQYGSYQFLHMVESAVAEDHGSYSWEIFVEGYSLPKYRGKLFIIILLDQLDFLTLPSLNSNLLSSPVWQSMNPESLLDDHSLSLRDRPSGASFPPMINQTGSGALIGPHQQVIGPDTCPGAAAQNLDTKICRRHISTDPCHCIQTVENAWNENSRKIEELINRGENESMPWIHLGSQVLHMDHWFLECLEWHLRGRVHDGPMKYILKQMVHDGKKIGHLVEHFASVDRYDLVNCIKAFHSCDYCEHFYKLK